MIKYYFFDGICCALSFLVCFAIGFYMYWQPNIALYYQQKTRLNTLKKTLQEDQSQQKQYAEVITQLQHYPNALTTKHEDYFSMLTQAIKQSGLYNPFIALSDSQKIQISAIGSYRALLTFMKLIQKFPVPFKIIAMHIEKKQQIHITLYFWNAHG